MATPKDFQGKMARHVKLVQEVSAASTSIHTLAQPALAVLSVLKTSDGAFYSPILHGKTVVTTRWSWNMKENKVHFYSTEGDAGACTITYLAEAP